MPDSLEDYLDPPKAQPFKTKRGALKFQPESDWSLARLPEVESEYQKTTGKPLPVSVRGQGRIHNKWNYDHDNSADIGVNPNSKEGRALVEQLQRQNIPFLAFDRAIPGIATGPHVHIGRPSKRRNAQQRPSGIESYLDSPQKPSKVGAPIEDYLDPTPAALPAPPRNAERQTRQRPVGGPFANAQAGAGPVVSDTGMGAFRQRVEDPEMAQRKRIERDVGGYTPRVLEIKNPADIVNERISEEQAQATQEAEAQKLYQRQKPEIDRLAKEYRQSLRGANLTGNKWFAETGAKGASGLTEKLAAVARSGLAKLPFNVPAEHVADTINVHAQAMHQAAVEEGADRNEASKWVQDIVGGFIASSPELVAMGVGVPAPIAFGAGEGLSAYGGNRPVAPAVAHGTITGAAFNLGGHGGTVGKVLKKAGTVGTATTGIELAAGHPLKEAAATGATNALLVGVPGLAGTTVRPMRARTKGEIDAREAETQRQGVQAEQSAEAATEIVPARPVVDTGDAKAVSDITGEPVHHSQNQLRRARNTATGTKGQFKKGTVSVEVQPEPTAIPPTKTLPTEGGAPTAPSMPENLASKLEEGARKGVTVEPVSELNKNLVNEIQEPLSPRSGSREASRPLTREAGNAVVNEKGEPLIVYHGTEQQFDVFDKSRKGTVGTIFGGEPVDREGYFFTPDKALAQEFGKNVVEARLSIKKPWDLRNGLTESMEAELSPNTVRWINSKEPWELFDGESGKQFVAELKRKGYDGAAINEDGGQSWVAFDPEQIVRPSSSKSPRSEIKATPPSESPSVREGVAQNIHDVESRSIPQGKSVGPSVSPTTDAEQLAALRAEAVAAGALTQAEVDALVAKERQPSPQVEATSDVLADPNLGIRARPETKSDLEGDTRAASDSSVTEQVKPTTKPAGVGTETPAPSFPDLPPVREGENAAVKAARERIQKLVKEEKTSQPLATESREASAAAIAATAKAEPSLISSARERLTTDKAFKESGGEYRGSGGPDTQKLIDYAIVHGWDVYQSGKAKFEDWSVEMKRRFGEDIEPHLRKVWAQVTGKEVEAGSEQIALSKEAINESPATMQKKADMVNQGKVPAMLYNPGQEILPYRKGLTETETEVGTWVHDPSKVKASEIRTKVADGTYHEILGITEPKSGVTDRVVTSRAPDGTEIESAAVSAKNEAAQVKTYQERSPDATIETGTGENIISDRTSAKNAATVADRAAYGFPERVKPQRESDQAMFAEAKHAHQADPTAAVRIADKVLSDKHRLTRTETIQLDIRAQEIKNEHGQIMKEIGEAKDADAIQSKSADADALKREFLRIIEADEASGSEQARDFRARRHTIDQDYKLLPMVATAKKTKGRNVTPEEEARYAAIEKERDNAIADRDAALEQLHTKELQKELDKVARTRNRAKKKETLDKEATVLRDNIVAEFMRLKATLSGTASMGGLGNLDPEGVITKNLLLYARNRVQANVGLKAEALIDDAHGLVERFGVTRRQVAEALTGYGLKTVDRRSEAAKKLQEIRDEITAMLKEEDVEAGRRSPRSEGPRKREQFGPKEGPRLSDAKKLPAEGPRLSDAKKLPAEGPRLSESTERVAGPKYDLVRNQMRLDQLLKQEKEWERKLNEREFEPKAKREPYQYNPDVRKAEDRVRIAEAKFNREMERERPGRWFRNASGILKASWLSGPGTQLMNTSGTASWQGFREAARLPTGIADALWSATRANRMFGATPGQATFTGRSASGPSPSAMLDSVLHAKNVGGREFMEIMRHGATKEQMEQHQYSRIDLGVNTGNKALDTGAKVIETAFNAVYDLMSASDRVFYQGAYKRNLIDRATVQAKNEGVSSIRERVKELVDNPTEQLDIDAKHDALRDTFNNSNALSSAVKRARAHVFNPKELMTKKNSIRLNAAQNFALDMVLPFDRTPTNVISRIVEASPLGYAKNAAQLIAASMRGSMPQEHQRQFMQTFGNATTGTALMALGWYLGDEAKGIITIDGYDAFLNIPGLPKINLRTASPVGNIMAAGARFRTIHDDPESSKWNYVKEGLREPFNQPLLRATSGATEFGRDPERSVNKTGARYAAGAIPFSGAMRWAGKAMDPAENRYPDNSFRQQFQKNIPGWRQSLPSTTDKLTKEKLTEAYRDKKISTADLDKMVTSNEISRSDADAISEAGSMSDFQNRFFNTQKAGDVLDRYERMDERQRFQVKEIMEKKAYTMTRSDAYTQTEKDTFAARIKKLGIQERAPEKKTSANPFKTGSASFGQPAFR